MWCVFAAFKTSFFFQPQTINHTPDMWLFSHQGFPLQLEPLKNRLFCRYLLSKYHLTWYHFVFSSHIWTEVWNDRLTVAINLIPGFFKVMCENEIYFFQNLLLRRILWDLLTIKIKYKMSFYSVNLYTVTCMNIILQCKRFFPLLHEILTYFTVDIRNIFNLFMCNNAWQIKVQNLLLYAGACKLWHALPRCFSFAPFYF